MALGFFPSALNSALAPVCPVLSAASLLAPEDDLLRRRTRRPDKRVTQYSMKHLLSLPTSELLPLLATCRALLAFDFDGTLAPITAKRDEATMRPSTASLFAVLSRRATCAVITGRSRADVEPRLLNATVPYIAGNHGLELDPTMTACDAAIADARVALSAAVLTLPGVELEDKTYSLSVHYREAEDPLAAREALSAAVATLRDVRIVPGKQVVNLVPARGANKGDALAAIMEKEHARHALYIGDDATDEDVFDHAIAAHVVGVRVGKSKASSARYYLQGQWEIDHLLQALLAWNAVPRGRL